MNKKKPFSDKRWTQPLGGTVVGYQEKKKKLNHFASTF